MTHLFGPPGGGSFRPTSDNHPTVRRRSPVVATEDLERALRDCLVDRAADAPRVGDLASRAIRRARRQRRARNGGVAVLAGCLLASAGIVGGQLLLPSSATTTALLAEPVLSAGPPLTTSGPAAPAAPLPFSGALQREPVAAVQLPPVDIVLAGELHTTDGQRVSLDPLVDVAQASRMSGGWLVVTDPSTDDGAGVWFVTTDGSPKAMLPGVDAVAVDEAGTRIAWRRGTEVAVASVVSGELTGTTTSPAPERSSPIGFAGDAVLMARDGAEHSRGYSVWRPEQGSSSRSGATPPARCTGRCRTARRWSPRSATRPVGPAWPCWTCDTTSPRPGPHACCR